MLEGSPCGLDVGSCSSESPEDPASNVLDGQPATRWRAVDQSATLELALQPPSTISAIVIHNCGCAELSFYAVGHGSSAGSFLGSAAPRHDRRAIGDVVQLLPPFKLASPRCMVVFRVGRGSGRLSPVSSSQPWTHIVVEARGLAPHPPGLSHVQVRQLAFEA